MIRTFAALKVRLMINGTRTGSQLAMLVLGLIGGTVLAASLFSFLASRGGAGAAMAPGDAAITATATVFFGWVAGSVLFLGVDETVDARRLLLLPLSPTQLYTGLATAALVGIGPVSAAVGYLGLVVGFAPLAPSAALVLAAAALAVLMPMLGSRALATALAGTLRFRWVKDLAMVLGAVLPMAGYLLPTLVAGGTLGDQSRLIDVLRLTPGGSPGQVVAAVDAGDVPGALLALAVSCAWTGAFAWAWKASLDRLLTEPEPAGASPRRTKGKDVASGFGWPSPTPTGAIRLRELRYLLRAPVRRALLVSMPVVVVLIALSQVVTGTGSGASGVYMAGAVLVFGSSAQLANQFGYHSRALWLEVLSTTSSRALVVGRQAAWQVTSLVPALILAPIMGVASGDWFATTLVVLAFAVAVPALVAAGTLASVLNANQVAEDANPFRTQGSGSQGCLAALLGLGISLGVLVVLAPPLAGLVLAVRTTPMLALPALVVLAAYAWGVRTACLALATRWFDARRGQLVETLSLARPPA